MSVFLVELKHGELPPHRAMIEASGPVGAVKAYFEQAGSVRKLDAMEALKLAASAVPLLQAAGE